MTVCQQIMWFAHGVGNLDTVLLRHKVEQSGGHWLRI